MPVESMVFRTCDTLQDVFPADLGQMEGHVFIHLQGSDLHNPIAVKHAQETWACNTCPLRPSGQCALITGQQRKGRNHRGLHHTLLWTISKQAIVPNDSSDWPNCLQAALLSETEVLICKPYDPTNPGQKKQITLTPSERMQGISELFAVAV